MSDIQRRDLFAAAAMIGLLAETAWDDKCASTLAEAAGDVDDVHGGNSVEQLADAAYVLADAMERRRSKT
jgi:hypothetical protein